MMPEFMETITIDHKLVRVSDYTGSPIRKFWKRQNINPTTVTVIGTRRLSNGNVVWCGDDMEGELHYTQTEQIRALLVVENMNKNPFYIETQ